MIKATSASPVSNVQPQHPELHSDWELEVQAKEWTTKAQLQSQQEALAVLSSRQIALAELVSLTNEPVREYLNHAAPSIEKTEAGTYTMTQVQARAGEDRGAIQIWTERRSALITVFDGHSPADAHHKGAAQYAMEHLGQCYLDQIDLGEHPLRAFQKTLLVLAGDIASRGYEDGTTVTACYHDEVTHTLYGATLGDSPATLYTRTKEGAFEVHRLAYRESWEDTQAQARVPKETDWRLEQTRIQHLDSGWLAVTRALGDTNFSPAVCADPILWMQCMNPDQEHVVVLASDGLSDWLSELECGNLIRNWSQHRNLLYPNYKSLSELLTAKARERAHAYHLGNTKDPDRIIDDITVITFISQGF